MGGVRISNSSWCRHGTKVWRATFKLGPATLDLRLKTQVQEADGVELLLHDTGWLRGGEPWHCATQPCSVLIQQQTWVCVRRPGPAALPPTSLAKSP